MDKNTTHFYTLSDNVDINGELLDCQEFYLLNEKKIFKIIVGKKEDGIIIKSINYVISFKASDLSSLIDYEFESIEEAYNFIINMLNKDKVTIGNIIHNEIMKIIMKIEINNKEEDVEINLKYNIDNKDFDYKELNKKYNKLNKDFCELKNENTKLLNELNELKIYYTQDNPKDIHSISDITKEAYSDDISDNTFAVFKTIGDFLYLIFTNLNKSIICYNIIEQKKTIEIKNSHNEHITNFRHFLDKIDKRDLLLSISSADKNIKMWDVNNWQCLLNISNIYNNGELYSACFINDNDNNYILTSNSNIYGDSGPIKVYDFSGNKIKEIEDSNENTSFIDTYYDNKFLINFILTGNSNYVKSYDFNKNELFQKYSDNYNNNHLSIIISEFENEKRLIESCYDGIIRIWNFYSGLLLSKIKIGNNWLYGICLWSDKYLFVGCSDRTIKLIDLTEEYIVKNFKGHNNSVCTIKKINHPQYGDCLISQGYNEDPIKLWAIKK
mgnify:CR=1 FL=1